MLPFSVSAQDKIEGIGRFKIGKTTIESLSDQPISKINEDYQRVAVGQKLVELTRNLTEPESTPSGTPFSKDVRVFYSDRHEVAGIELIDLYLTFYKGVLHKIAIDHSDELIEALTLKYGKPKVELKTTPIKCVYRLTGRASKPKVNQTSKTYWLNNNVSAIYFYSLKYNSDCEADYFDYFHIIDITKDQEVNSIEAIAKKEYELKMKEAKQKSLSDF